MKKYRLQLLRDGGNFINVLKHIDGNNYSIHWRIELGNSQPIVLWTFIDDKRFVVVDWMAKVWVFDIERKEEVYKKAFSSEITGKAILSDDKKQLYVCYSKSDPHVAILNLENFSLVRDLAYPDMGYVYHFQKYRDMLMLYSCTDWDEWSHHYDIVDIETGEFSNQVIPFTQFDDSDRKRPLLDEKNGKLIMPYWGEIKHRKGADGEPIFVYKMMIVDMETFEVEKVFPVREFPVQQIACYERDGIKAAERLLAVERGENYQEGMGNLMLNMNSMQMDEDGKSFWLCWRGGIVRKVDYDGNMSPMYATKTRPHNTVVEAFNHNFFHSSLSSISDKGFIFQEGGERLWMERPTLKELNAAIGDFVAIDLVPIPETESIVIVKSEEDQENEAERIFNVVRFNNMDDQESILEALDFMIESEWKQVGHYLAFLFKDKDKNTYSEKVFYKEIHEIDGALDRMEKIAKKALKIGVHDRWGGDNDQTMLFNLFFHLCDSDAKYSEIGFRYIDEMDADHDRESCSDMIYAVQDAMGHEAWKKELEKRTELAEYIEYFGLDD